MIELEEEYTSEYLHNTLTMKDYYMEEYGPYLIGEAFMVFKNLDTGFVYSFVLTGTQGENNVWKCIYKD